MFIETEWIVITGPPSSGKTTSINILNKMGYEIFPDVARMVIENVDNLYSYNNEEEKQRIILDSMISGYNNLNRNDIVFCEYGMIDNLVFQEFYGVYTETLKELCSKFEYKEIVLLEPVGLEIDSIRTISLADQKELFYRMLLAYKKHGYSPFVIEKMSPLRRAEHILEKLGLSK